MICDLPESVNVNGIEFEIRSDFRAILDICIALNDAELDEQEKAYVALKIFYPDCESITDYQEALNKCFWFINCGDDEPDNKKSPKLVDWEQDFQYIVAPINRVAGTEIRATSYMHWWTFISYYNEIGGDCTFSQIVSIRDKKARGKALDKADMEWYRRNRKLVDFKRNYSDAENELMKQWGG